MSVRVVGANNTTAATGAHDAGIGVVGVILGFLQERHRWLGS